MMRLAIVGGFFLLALTACNFFSGDTDTVEEEKRVPATAKTDIGNWQSGGPACSGDQCRIKIVITPRAACHLGDLEIIGYDLTKSSQDPTALLTVEPILARDVATQPWFSQRIPFSQLRAGVSYDMAFAPLDHPVQLGFFLCKDHTKANRCLGKGITQVMNIVVDDALLAKRQKQSRVESPDRIYFFQYILFDGQTWKSFRDMSQMGLTSEIFDERARELADLANPQEKESFRKSMQLTRDLSRAIQSMPLEFTPGEVHLVLPYKSADCRKTTSH
jgi:hypothetical protein